MTMEPADNLAKTAGCCVGHVAGCYKGANVKTETINETKLNAYGKQFPWFLEWFQKCQASSTRACGCVVQVGNCRVSRMDLKLCQRVVDNDRLTIGIFDAHGKNLGHVGWNGKQKGLFSYLTDAMFGYGFNRECLDPSETIEMAINRLTGDNSVPFYVVAYQWFFSPAINQYESGSAIFKPKGESLSLWLAELRIGQAEQLKKDLAEIG